MLRVRAVEASDVTDKSEETADEQVEQAMVAFHEHLKDAGLKSTKQRDAIAQVFFSLDKHITAEELTNAVKEEGRRVGYATVYRTLNLLVEQGFAVEKDFGDGCKRYDPVHNQDPHHDHLICVDCRKVIEFNDDEFAERAAAITRAMGYELRRKKLELYAECQIKDCPNKSA